MINCYRVSIKKQLDKLTITSQALPSFFLCEGAARDIPDLKVTHLKWTSSEDCDSLLVGTKCSTGSFLELWCLVEKSTPIHKLFQNPNKTEVFKFVVSEFFWEIWFFLFIGSLSFFCRYGHIKLIIDTPVELPTLERRDSIMEILHTFSCRWMTIQFTVYIVTHWSEE